MSIILKKEYGKDGDKKSRGNTMEEMLEENLKLTKEMHEMVVGIKKYVFWARVGGFLKILLIVVPIILSIIFLPPLLKGVLGQYNDLLGEGVSSANLLNSLDPSMLTGDLKNLIR